jgi:Mrp family chromosome partitioning ATPase/capsular polysaccharide biosynthesis protein
MATPSQSTASLRNYALILWRRKWIILESVIIIPAIVLAVSLTRPTMYSSTALVVAEPQSSALNVAVPNVDVSAPDERQLLTLSTLVVTRDNARRVRDQLGWSDQPETLMVGVSAEADPTTDIISITAEASDPDKAAAVANAFADAFVSWRREQQQQTIDEAVTLLEEQIAQTGSGSIERVNLQQTKNQLEVVRALVNGGVTVAQEAEPSSTPSSPKPLRDAVLAAGAGLVVGIGLAFLREALDVKLHSPEEIAARTELPIIAAVPEFRKIDKSADKLVALDDPRSPTAEAYRFLRTNLEFVNFNQDVRVILVTSPLPGQGKSTTIANLAIALLRAGKRVSVVEGDLRRPSLHRFFKIANARGVTNVVSGSTPLEDAVQVLTFKDAATSVRLPKGDRNAQAAADDAIIGGELKLRLLPSGPLPPNPGEIVSSRQLAAIIETLKTESDYVLVDAPPMFAVGDAAAMASVVDGMIVILRLDQTTPDTIKGVEEFLERVPTRALGIVVTGTARTAKSKYYRYQEYYD